MIQPVNGEVYHLTILLFSAPCRNDKLFLELISLRFWDHSSMSLNTTIFYVKMYPKFQYICPTESYKTILSNWFLNSTNIVLRYAILSWSLTIFNSFKILVGHLKTSLNPCIPGIPSQLVHAWNISSLERLMVIPHIHPLCHTMSSTSTTCMSPIMNTHCKQYQTIFP